MCVATGEIGRKPLPWRKQTVIAKFHETELSVNLLRSTVHRVRQKLNSQALSIVLAVSASTFWFRVEVPHPSKTPHIRSFLASDKRKDIDVGRNCQNRNSEKSSESDLYQKFEYRQNMPRVLAGGCRLIHQPCQARMSDNDPHSRQQGSADREENSIDGRRRRLYADARRDSGTTVGHERCCD